MTYKRIDANQNSIVKALRDANASVQSLAKIGNGCPDLLVGYASANYLIEIKNPDMPINKRNLTPDQKKWHCEWAGIINVIETPEEALRLIGK